MAMKVVRAIGHSQGHKQTLTRPRLAVVPDSRHAGTHGNTEGHHAPVSGLTEFLGAPSLRV